MTNRRKADTESPVWDSTTPIQRAFASALLAFVLWLLAGGACLVFFFGSLDTEAHSWAPMALLIFFLIYVIVLLLIPYKVWRASYIKGRRVIERDRNDPSLAGVEIISGSAGKASGEFKQLRLDDIEPRHGLIVIGVASIILTGILGSLFYKGYPVISPLGLIALIMFLALTPLLISSAISTFRNKRLDVWVTPAHSVPGDTLTVRIVGRGQQSMTYLDVALACRWYYPKVDGDPYSLVQWERLLHLRDVSCAPGKLLMEFIFTIPPDWPWCQKLHDGSCTVCELRVDQEFGPYSFQRLYYRVEID